MSAKQEQFGFTYGQRCRFYPVKHNAWIEECARYGADASDAVLEETWYRAELVKLGCFGVGGKPSLKLCERVKGFDRVMGHFALLANDQYWIAKTARNAEDVMLYLICEWREKITALTHQPLTAAYEAGIAKHMHFATDPKDIPVEHLDKVFMSLDTHLRRLLRRSPQEAPAGLPF